MYMEFLSLGNVIPTPLYCQLTILFVNAPALDVALLLLLWHVYISLLSLHLAGAASLLCFVFSLKLNSSFSFPSERQLACYLVKARPLSRRRLQLTIVGFHHRHECAASLVVREFASPHYPSSSPSCPLLALLPASSLPVAVTTFCTAKLTLFTMCKSLITSI